MQQDVRRSEPTDVTVRAEPDPAPKASGFARGLFQFGTGKRQKTVPAVEPGRLQNRLKEVLERDRALAASQPPQPADSEGAVASDAIDGPAYGDAHAEEAWAASLGPEQAEQRTGTRATLRASSDFALSQIASWIEEEISELAEPSAEPVALDAPLDEVEVAELDAVLAETDTASDAVLSAALLPSPVEASPAPERATRSKPKLASGSRPAAAKKPAPQAAPEPEDEAPTREPIRTRTMARLLAMQGYKPRAIAVYRELIERAPDDETLRAEYEKLLAE